jgi:hypothetical protein
MQETDTFDPAFRVTGIIGGAVEEYRRKVDYGVRAQLQANATDVLGFMDEPRMAPAAVGFEGNNRSARPAWVIYIT